MIIYAGSLDFGLERKLRRLQERRGELRRTKDASDAVALVHQMKGGSPHPLAMDSIRSLNRNGFEPPLAKRAIDAVALDYIEKYRVQGIAEMVWDDKRAAYKYLDLENQWVWYE